MGILWTIVIGFVAGIIAKFLHPGPNGTLWVYLDNHPGHRWSLPGDIPRSSPWLVSR